MTARPYLRILTALDLGADSWQIAERGPDLAARCGIRLSLLHVIESVPPDPGGEIAPTESADIRHRQDEQARRALNRLAEALKLPAEDCLLRHGTIKIESTRAVRELNADLVVLGRHEHLGLSLPGAEPRTPSYMRCEATFSASTSPEIEVTGTRWSAHGTLRNR